MCGIPTGRRAVLRGGVGGMEAARALLDAGADPRASADRLLTDPATGVKGVTPEEVAVRNGHEAVAAMLRTAAGAR